MGLTHVDVHARLCDQPERWTEWSWQQQNAVRTVEQLQAIFPDLPAAIVDAIRAHAARRRLQITPYALSLVETNASGTAPAAGDPMWRQFVPHWDDEGDTSYSYDGVTDNWEMPDEMVTPIAQRKYEDRLLVRLANICHAYCHYCYEALRTLEREQPKPPFEEQHWRATLAYIAGEPAIQEVLLSGGEPMMLSDQKLRRVFTDLRGVREDLVVRMNTRALTFNPFRFTDGALSVFEEGRLNAIGIHVTHPREVTAEFAETVRRLHRSVPVLFANAPLLRGVNDSVEVLTELFMSLYRLGVTAGNLYHFMPRSPGARAFATRIRKGVEIVHAMRGRVSGPAVPRYVIQHPTGKHPLPVAIEPDELPSFTVSGNGPVVRYRNWRGEHVEYPDADWLDDSQ
jgi:lysine 2,3-aminomutase